MPRSTMMGLTPASTSSNAANSPAGPAPTITTLAAPALLEAAEEQEEGKSKEPCGRVGGDDDDGAVL